MPMQPIRWDNIGGGGLSEAARPLDSAASLFTNAFSGLQNVLAQREAVDTANWQTTKANNTNKFLNDLYGRYTNAGDLNSAIKNGDIAKQLAGYGYQIDSNAVRGAADSRMQALMQQATQKIAYDHAMTDERVAPLLDQFKSAVLEGGEAGKAKAAALQAQYMQMGGRNLADLAAYQDQRGWTINERGMKLEDHQMNADQTRANITHMQNQDANSAVMAGAQAQQAKTQSELARYQIDTGTQDRRQALAAGMAAAIETKLKKDGNLYSDGIYNGGDAAIELRDFMTKNKVGGGNENKQSEIMGALTELQKTGILARGPNGGVLKGTDGLPIIIRDIPMAAVKQAMSVAGDPLVNFGWNTGPAKEFKNALEKIVGASSKNKDGTYDVKARDDLRQYTAATTNSAENAPPIKSFTLPAYGKKR